MSFVFQTNILFNLKKILMLNPSATQSVECSIFSFIANSGLLKKLSIHSACPWPNMGSKSSSTTAAVLGVSGVIRLDCGTVFLPLSTRIHHKCPVLDSHRSKVVIHWLSEPLLPLLYAQYQYLGQQLIDVHWKHVWDCSFITFSLSKTERTLKSAHFFCRRWTFFK